MNRKFLDTLKRADVTPIFKKGSDNEKENYHPVSILSTFSKVFEKLLFEPTNDHMQSKFSQVSAKTILQVSAKTTVLKMIYWL